MEGLARARGDGCGKEGVASFLCAARIFSSWPRADIFTSPALVLGFSVKLGAESLPVDCPRLGVGSATGCTGLGVSPWPRSESLP